MDSKLRTKRTCTFPDDFFGGLLRTLLFVGFGRFDKSMYLFINYEYNSLEESAKKQR